jgi:hypothetical protein
MTVACSRPEVRRLRLVVANEVGGDLHQPRPNAGGVRKPLPRLIRLDETVASGFRAKSRARSDGGNPPEDSWPVEPDQRMEILDLSGAMLFGAIFRKIGVRRDAGLFSIRRCRPISTVAVYPQR